MTSTTNTAAVNIKAFIKIYGDAQLIESIGMLEAIPAAALTSADRAAYCYAKDEIEARHPALRVAADAWYADLNATGTYAELARSTFDDDGFRIGAFDDDGCPLRD
jgi:hypothetical protein